MSLATNGDMDPHVSLHLLERYAVVIMPALVVAEQIGVPLPAVPALLAVGALAAHGRVNVPLVIGVMAVVDKLVRLFAQTAAFSLPLAALRYLPAAWSRSEAEFDVLYVRMRNVIVAALAAATAVGVVGVLIRPEWFGDELQGRTTILLAAFATLPVLGLVPFIQSALAGRIAPGRAMAFVLLDAVVLMMAAAVGAFWGGLTGIYIAYAAAGSLQSLFGLSWPRRGTTPARRAWSTASRSRGGIRTVVMALASIEQIGFA